MTEEPESEKTRIPGDDGIESPPQPATTPISHGRVDEADEKRGLGRTNLEAESSTPTSSSTVASTESTMAPLVATESTTTTPAPGRFSARARRDGREYLDGPPPLPFNMREHKLSIAIFTFLALAECCFIPIGLYYGLSRGTDLRSGLIFAAITSLFGFVTGYEFGIRGWRLVRKSDEYRPLYHAWRWGFDSTQHITSGPITIMTVILIIFSVPRYPSVHALALPMPVGMINLGLIMLANGWAASRGWRLMYFRLSSHIKTSICPPLTFCVLEDVCAVDGKGGKKFRMAAMARYNASPRFRALMMQLLWFWTIPLIVLGAAIIAIIYNTSADVAYGIGWGAPAVWSLLWTWFTILLVQRGLRIEKETWASDRTSSV